MGLAGLDRMASESGSARGRRPKVNPVPLRQSALEAASCDRVAKPTAAGLGVDLATLDWQRSGTGAGSFEVAFVASRSGKAAEWVLLRVADDPSGRVLVYGRNEWLCFLDGASHGEFDSFPARPSARRG